MSNIISSIFIHSIDSKTYEPFKEYIKLIKLIDINNIDFEKSYFGYENDLKKDSFLIEINSKNNIHIPIKIEIDFIYNSCFYSLGKCMAIEETYGGGGCGFRYNI